MLRSFPVSYRHHSTNYSTMSQHLIQHKCYFHNTNNIIKFCINKKCTLPLCQKCIPIHLKQHNKEQKSLGKENIILYTEAHHIAVQQLASILQKKQQNIQIFKQTVKNIRRQIQQIIDNEFTIIEKNISNKVNEIKMLSQKHTKIKKGSLKATIFYFADEQGFKITSQTNRNTKLNMTDQISRLLQKLQNEKKRFQNGNDSSRYILDLASNRKNQTSRPKESESSSIQKQNQKSIKFESGTDFDKVLKDQKSRLENVRSKNIMFATNSESLIRNEDFKKYGSKSVDNFYSNKNLHENQEVKQENENRPLQFGFKTNSQSFSMKNQNFESFLSSQQAIDKIRKKYIGDQSLSKQKVILTEEMKRQPLRTMNLNDTKSQKLHSRQTILSDRILGRQSIRYSVEKKLQQKINKNGLKTQKQFDAGFDMNKQNHETFRKLQKPSENDLKVKQQEFILNKNYALNDTQKMNLDKQKILMSSIKKELRVIPMDVVRPKQGMFGHFFEGKNEQKLSSFDIKQGKDIHLKEIQNKQQQQISDFVMDQLERSREENLVKKQLSKKKEKLYEDSRQQIKLSQPTQNKIDYPQSKSHQQKQKVQTMSNIKNTKTAKEGRRFNYLYDNS